jgi:hypothetical protein
MYEYCIVVPAQHADEVENVLRDVAEVRNEGTMPAPDDMASDEAWAIQAGAPLAILTIKSPTLQSAVDLKNWVELRFADPYVDIRGRDASGAFSFSFTGHSAGEIKNWIENMSSGVPQPGQTRQQTGY